MNKHISIGLGYLIVSLLAGCGGSSSSSTGVNSPETSAPSQYQAMQFVLGTNQTVYTQGQTVSATLTSTNTGSSDLAFDDISPPVDATVYRGSQLIWQMTGLFDGVTSGTPLAPGASLSDKLAWNLTDQSGNPVPPGQYVITAWSTRDFYGDGANAETDMAAKSLTVTVQ